MKPQNRFLLASLGNAAVTANALRPVSKTGPLSVPSFVNALVPSELPVQEAVLQAGFAGLFTRSGGTKGWQGKLGLALNAASGVGLAHLLRVARQSGTVLEAALVDELGEGYRKRISEPFSPKPDVVLTSRRIIAPDFGARRRYRTSRDLAYGDMGRRNQLDVWHRADLAKDAKAPVLVQVHGGAWTMGQKEGQAEPLMGHLAERGWVCVAPNYRLSPRATWPDHIVDVKRALAWVKANIADHGGDPDFVVITGGSAGGHLCALAALTPDLAAFQPGFEDADTSVAAAVPFYGVYDLTNKHGTSRADIGPFLAKRVFKSELSADRENWEQASPVNHARPDAPPFFVLHGTNDSLVPVEQARTFVDELRKESSSPVVYAELPLAQHAFDVFPSIRTHHTIHAVERFLAVVRSEHGGRTPAEAVSR
jgi:acetyl esterase/lipase